MGYGTIRAPAGALLAEDGRSSPTSVGRVRIRAQIGAQLARGWEWDVALSERSKTGPRNLGFGFVAKHIGFIS